MKKLIFAALTLVALSASPAFAQLTFAPGYGSVTTYTHTSSDAIISYDWDSGANLYYMTATPSFGFGGFYSYSGSTPIALMSASSNFPGNSVVVIGSYVYFNTENQSGQFIFRYGPTPGPLSLANVASTAPNYGLYGHNGDLFITGSVNFGTNHIYYSDLNTGGGLTNNPPVDLGVTSGSSGPISFDLAGNLYYAPGFGDLSIYKWSAAEVAAAIANDGHPLVVSGHEWLDYSGLDLTEGGATSMLIDADGDLLLTLSNFGDPSVLVEFGVNLSGSFDGVATTILTSDAGNRLGELRSRNGDLYVSSGNQVLQIVPEPGSGLLIVLASGAVLGFLRARRQDRLAPSES